MVKHQRRSHQRGLYLHDIQDDYSSDSDGGEYLATPPEPMDNRMHSIPQPLGHESLYHHRNTSFPDYGHCVNLQNPAYSSTSHPGSGPQYHRSALMEDHAQSHVLQRTSSMPQHSFYLNENDLPLVDTSNMSHGVRSSHVPRHSVSRQALRMSLPLSDNATHNSIDSSPRAASTTSTHSPAGHDQYYTHQPSQGHPYELHPTSHFETQHSVTQYHVPSQPQPEALHHLVPNTGLHIPTAPVNLGRPLTPTPNMQSWYHYQPPSENATIGQLPLYTNSLIDIYAPKLDFEDPSMPLPSARLEQML